MYSTSDFRRGLKIIYQNEPYEMTDFQHHKPGKGAAVVRTKLKNLITGSTCDPTFRSGDKVGQPDIDDKDVQFLYESDKIYHFMDPASFEQYEVSGDILKGATAFLVENLDVSLLFYMGKVIRIDLPNHVVLKVEQCDPAVRGDTVSGATKPATMASGHTCQVPLFINEGDSLRIDTRNGDYLERA